MQQGLLDGSVAHLNWVFVLFVVRINPLESCSLAVLKNPNILMSMQSSWEVRGLARDMRLIFEIICDFDQHVRWVFLATALALIKIVQRFVLVGTGSYE